MATANIHNFPLFAAMFLFCCYVSHCHDYDYMWLVQSWPPSFCKMKTCQGAAPKEFTMHGTWPQLNNSNAKLLNCNPQAYDENVTAKMEVALNQSWPNLENRSLNKKFWRREWEKHGSCALPELPQVDYFQRTLILKNKYNLITFLAEAKIYPGIYQNPQAIEAAITKKVAKPMLRCKTMGGQRKQRLVEIALCVDQESEAVIHCNDSSKRATCTATKIDFPAI